MGTTIIAIDPGASGGIAYVTDRGAYSAKFDGMTEADIRDHLEDILGSFPDAFAYIEQVGANRNRAAGGRAQGSSGMFTFGRSYGFLRGLLIALRIPFEEVRPQVWLPAMGLRGVPDETPTQKKNRHKAKAQQLFPKLTVTLATCDAILLAEYGRRTLSELSAKEA